jgi:AcrR family transcriptional regulator
MNMVDPNHSPATAPEPGVATGEPAVPTRRSRRAVQTLAMKTDIAQAALGLMLDRGYVATSIGAIADEAGVAVQTIYNSIGNKADVLSAVLDLAAAGPETPALVPAVLRERVASTRTAADVIAVLADWFAELHVRTAAVFQVIAQAAAVDPEIAKLEQRRATQRLVNYGEAAAVLRDRRGLRRGLSDHEAAALIWSIGHPQAYRTLVGDVGWSQDAYQSWLRAALTAALT